MHATEPLPIKTLSYAELSAAIDVLLLRAGGLAPPRSIIESEQLSATLSQIARARDELHRRARAREAPSTDVSTGTRRGRQWIEHAPRESEIDSLVDAVQDAKQRAGANLLAQGRDPAGARVLLSGLRDSFMLRGASASRFRKIVTACERRALIVLDGPFVEIADGRSPGGRGAGTAHRVLAEAA